MSTEDGTNTAQEQQKKIPGKPFKKGDARINRRGRPKSFDQWRNLTIEVLREEARDKNGQQIIIDGHIATNAEMIARSWLSDKKRQPDLIAAAFGKVPDITENKGQVEVIVTYRNQSPGPASGADDDQAAGEPL